MCDKINPLFWDKNTWVTTVAKEFPASPTCNGFLIINAGTAGSIVFVDGAPITVGNSISYGGNRGEIFKGRVQIAFNNVGTSQAIVIEKFYINPDQFDK